jgi:integrase
MKVSLTDRFVASAKLGTYFDEQVTGLSLRALEGGKTWSFAYTTPGGRRTQFKLGTYPAASLAAARALAIEARGIVDRGQDPQAAFSSQAAGAMTVAALVDAYLAHPDKTKLRTHAKLSRRMHKNVVPLIGGIPIAQIRRRDVRRCTDVVLARGRAVEAARVFEDVRAMLRWAVQRGDIENNPMEAMRKPDVSKPRTRMLTEEEIRSLWNGLPKTLIRSKTCQRIIKLCLITGQRVGEVAGMRVAELDLHAKSWIIPGERTKNQYQHTVPLSDLAIEVIRESIADADGSPFVFPADEGPFAGQAVARTILRGQGRFGIESWSAHDLRRTAITNMAALGIEPIVLANVANHRSATKAGVTFSIYVKHDYSAEKRRALDMWAERLAAIVGDTATAEIVKLLSEGAR